MEEILARLEIDAQILSLCGGWGKVLEQMPPTAVRKFEWPTEPLVLPPPWRRLDPAIQAWAAMCAAVPVFATKTDTPERLKRLRLGLQTTREIPRTDTNKRIFTVYLAANGAGKSTVAARHGELLDLDMAVVSTRTYDAYRRVSGKDATMHGALSDLQARLWKELVDGRYIGWLAQYKIDALVPPPSERNYEVRVVAVNIPSETIRTRLEARNWTAARIERRLQRWTAVMENLQQAVNLTREEKRKIEIVDTWPL